MASKKDNLKLAFCYIPLVAIILFFIEDKKTEELMKHIKYGIILFAGYVIIDFLLWVVFWWMLSWIIFLVYIGLSGFLWYKAYSWEEVNMEYIDKFEDKIKDSISDSKKKK